MLTWIRANLQLSGCDETNIRKIELAAEEALVNIIQHAYKDALGDIQLHLRRPSKHSIELTLKDTGPAFNPLEQETDFDPLATLEEREVGGLGILFIRQYMDEIRYKRENETNTLILIKKI